VSVLTSQVGRERLSAAESSTSQRLTALRTVAAIIENKNFWDGLALHVDSLLPTVEASPAMQSGSATLAYVLYCFARQYQCLARGTEDAVLQKLEQRFRMYELPLLFLSMWLHPKFRSVGERLLTKGSLSMVDAI
jgi:hypothetical protein